ncbi:hypothetical protein F5887DRAFT_1086014 [Amanita rubescens]|nr:hypothetical protein F5887DRAFT_1086014 [Amanita rubescens]
MPNPEQLNISSEKLSVVFVANPSALHDAQNDYDNLTFLSVVDTPACHKMKKCFPNLVHETESGWDIYDWLFIPYVMERGIGVFQWEVNYVTWREYSKAIISSEGHTWDMCISAKLICGGLNFSSDFMDPASNYGLSSAEVRLYWEGMDTLLQHVKVWPHPQDLLRDGSKCYFKHLEKVATEITHTKYPATLYVDNPLSPSIIGAEDFPSGMEYDLETCAISEDMVLKRTFSSAPQHVFQMTSTDYETIVKDQMDKTVTHYGYFGNWIKPAWFATPHINSMKFGELRVMFVGGHMIYVLFTNRYEGVFSAREAVVINPLSSLNKTKSLDEPSLNYWSTRDGTLEFHHFATNTFQALLKEEEESTRRTSSLRIFCRLDISVMESAGQYCYYVSGLERSSETEVCLSCTLHAPTFAITMADALGGYVIGRLID